MLLAVDSSTQWIGLALYDGNQVIGEMAWRTQNHHTIELAPAVGSLLKRTGVQSVDLQALAVALGPGSFTSLRIGLAIIKGMALALHLPVVGVPTLDILAAAQPTQELPLAAILPAGRKRLAAGWYNAVDGKWIMQGDIKVCTVEELAQQIRKPSLVCGELSANDRHVLARKYKNVVLVPPAQSARRPAFLAEIAWQRWQAGLVDNVMALAPIYLHVVDSIPA